MTSLMLLVYNLLFGALLVGLVPLDLVRGWRKGRPRKGILERFGFFQKRPVDPDDRRTLWIHAVSVGETRAALTLAECLKVREPGNRVVITCFTETGYGVAQNSSVPDRVYYAPVDLSMVVARFVRHLRPDVLVIMETELWPALIATTRRLGVPVVLVNGRISEKSLPGYLRFRALLQPFLRMVTSFYMQSERDAERIASIGAPTEKIIPLGNLKFDQIRDRAPTKPDEARKKFCLPHDCPIWVAGSTHAGEEEQIATIYDHLRKAGLRFHLVLVPRHPERAGAVAQLLDNRGLDYMVRSRIAPETETVPGRILLVDTIGELDELYSVADIVFIGGSLVPHGGHNILEPLSYGKPVLWGPHMQNFRDISKLALAGRGGMQVANQNELQDVLRHFFDSPRQFVELGKNGRQLLENNRGTASRLAEALLQL